MLLSLLQVCPNPPLSVSLSQFRCIQEIELENDGTGLGFGIVGGKSSGITVKTILPGGVADRVTCTASSVCFSVVRYSIVHFKLINRR